jgi:hypothetical protein
MVLDTCATGDENIYNGTNVFLLTIIPSQSTFPVSVSDHLLENL